MISLVIGDIGYIITFAFIIYYQMIKKHKDREWLIIYLPLCTVGFILLNIFYALTHS
jgi:hypothetical protein